MKGGGVRKHFVGWDIILICEILVFISVLLGKCVILSV